MQEFQCVLRPTLNTPSILIRQLALFYDKIYIMPTAVTGVYPQVWQNLQRRTPDTKEKIHLDYYQDTERMLHLPPETTPWRDPQMAEVISSLREWKIIEDPIQVKKLTSQDPISSIRDWSRIAARIDTSDPGFNALCHTSMDDYKQSVDLMFVALDFIDEQTKEPMTIPVVLNEPNAIRISQDITDSFLMADAIDAFPVFDASLRSIIDYKYRMAQSSIETAMKLSPKTRFTLDEKSKLGDIIFTLSNELFNSHLIKELNIKELVDYRNAMEDSRKKFISLNMVGLLALIDSAPWTNELEREVVKYVREKLTISLYEFNEQSVRIWEKIQGKLIVNLSKVSSFALTGAVAGVALNGIAGNVIPNAGLPEILFLSLLGAAKGMPDLVKDLLESIHELRSLKRNSIAYLANLAQTN